MNLRSLYSLGISSGHHRGYSTEFLNFFLLGADDLTSNTFFKMREILNCVCIFKGAVNHVMRMFGSGSLGLMMIFSDTDQFCAVTSMVESETYLDRMNTKLGYTFFSILKPQSGFLTSNKRLIAPEFIVGSLPDDIYYSRTVFLAFGHSGLITAIKELNGKVGSLSCGVVDSNQKHIWSNTDYIIPGNDDSVRVPFFIATLVFNAMLYTSQNFFYSDYCYNSNQV